MHMNKLISEAVKGSDLVQHSFHFISLFQGWYAVTLISWAFNKKLKKNSRHLTVDLSFKVSQCFLEIVSHKDLGMAHYMLCHSTLQSCPSQ